MTRNHKPKQILENGRYSTQVVQLEWKPNHKQQPILVWTLQVTQGPYRGQLIYHENVLDESRLSYYRLRSDLLVGRLILQEGVNPENTSAPQPLIGQTIKVEIETRGNRTSTTFMVPEWTEKFSFYLAVGIPLPDEEFEEINHPVPTHCPVSLAPESETNHTKTSVQW